MSALQLLQAYGSDSEDDFSGEEFIGFDNLAGDRFPSSILKYAAICHAVGQDEVESAAAAGGGHAGDEVASNEIADLVHNETCGAMLERSSQSQDGVQSDGNFRPAAGRQVDGESDSDREDDLESDGSYFNIDHKKRKRTKKEKLRMQRAKKRRLRHDAIIEGCGCRKECDRIISKDERVNIHDRFWKLRFIEQSNFIREHVHRSSAQCRRKNRFAADAPKKEVFAHVYPQFAKW